MDGGSNRVARRPPEQTGQAARRVWRSLWRYGRWPTQALRLAAVALTVALAACSHPRYYAGTEHQLATDDHFAAQGHFAVYYPGEIALDFPGYVVGLEMTDRAAFPPDSDLLVEPMRHAGASIERLTRRLREGAPGPDATTGQGQIPFISHVVRYRGQPLGAGNCALYSVYQSMRPELMDFCDGVRRPLVREGLPYRSAYADSWGAIDVLKDAMQGDAASGDYTHLIVAVMGWRTTQEEAIRNFNSIARAVHMAAQGAFRPLFIGITWVGPWASRWLDPLAEGFAYGNMADLADTLGLSWIGVLAEEVVLPLSTRLPAVFITHSFGTRAATTAVCIGPAIRRDGREARKPAQGTVDRIIGFQPAFSLQRLKKEQLVFFYEDIHFPNDCDRARSIVLTTSRHDTATRAILWADLAGNHRYFRSFCRKNAGTLVSCTSVDEDGNIEDEFDRSMKVLYLDATKLIRYRAPGTNGGAHSDIFRSPTGRLIWSLISKDQPAVRRPDAAR
jgi:hypothetical protein